MVWRKDVFKSIYVRIFFVICVAVLPSFAVLCLYVYEQRGYLTEYSTENAERFVQLAAHDEACFLTTTGKSLKPSSKFPLFLGAICPNSHN